MKVKHSGSDTVFEAFVGADKAYELYLIVNWCNNTFPPDRVTCSREIATMSGWRMTFWFEDRQAAMLFKLRWVNA